MAAPLNGDLDRRVLMRTAQMDWVESPSGGVARKRLHRLGPEESGQVTSVVRYAPGARFSAHPHPQGEEILVLSGVFSDHSGDYPAGTWLANPEGFEHAPFSEPGCTLFVKLRQYPGVRPHLQVDTADAGAWSAAADGVRRLPLFEAADADDSIRMEERAAGVPGTLGHAGGLELFVVSGALEVDGELLGPGDWLRLPPAETARVMAVEAARLWIKQGADRILRTASENE